MGGGFFMPFLHRIFVKRANFQKFISYIGVSKYKFSNKRRYQYAFCSELSELRYGLFVAPQHICKNATNITVSV